MLIFMRLATLVLSQIRSLRDLLLRAPLVRSVLHISAAARAHLLEVGRRAAVPVPLGESHAGDARRPTLLCELGRVDRTRHGDSGERGVKRRASC